MPPNLPMPRSKRAAIPNRVLNAIDADPWDRSPERSPEAVIDHSDGLQASGSHVEPIVPASHGFRVQSRMARAVLRLPRSQHRFAKWVNAVARAHATRRMLDAIDAWLRDNPTDPRRSKALELRAAQHEHFDRLRDLIGRPPRRASAGPPWGAIRNPERPTTTRPPIEPGLTPVCSSEGSGGTLIAPREAPRTPRSGRRIAGTARKDPGA